MKEQKWFELKIYRDDFEYLTERKNLQKNVLGHEDVENSDNCVGKITIDKQIGLFETLSDSDRSENDSENADILSESNEKLCFCTRRMLTLLILSLVFLIFIFILFQPSFLLGKEDEDLAANMSTYTVYDIIYIIM